MNERPDEPGASSTQSEPAPDWQSETPKPIELPPLAEAEEEQRRERRRRRGSGGALLLLLILVLALVGTSPFWAPPVSEVLPWGPRSGADALAPQLAQLQQRVDALAQHQAALEERAQRDEGQAQGAAAQAATLKDLGDRVAALEQRPAANAGAAGEIAALKEQLSKLGADQAQNADRVAKLETRANEGGARADEALLIALGQLRDQLASARPFSTQLDTVDALARQRPELREMLQPLAGAAATGVPSLAVLRQRFTEEVAPAVLRHAAAPESDGWGDYVWGRLRSLVTIRRVGGNAAASDDPVQASLAHAETALAAGDLAAAAKAVESLPQAAAAPASNWLAAAHQRLALEQAVARATGALTARLGDSGDSAPPAPGSDAGNQGSQH